MSKLYQQHKDNLNKMAGLPRPSLRSILVEFVKAAMDDPATSEEQMATLARLRAYIDINLKNI